MDVAAQFFGKQAIDQPLAGEPVLPGEGPGNDLKPEMAFAAGPGAGMAFMAMGLVMDFQPGRQQCRNQLGADAVGGFHGENNRFLKGLSGKLDGTMYSGLRLVRAFRPLHTDRIMPRSSLASHAGPAREAGLRACDHPGCAAAGEFRAPRSRAALNQFYWFCLDHVRAYNAGWNYYAGMSMNEIEQEIRHDTVWQRPTWPFGTRLGRFAAHIRDHGLFGFEDEAEPGKGENGAKRHTHPPASPEAQALAVFNLEPPVTLPGLKARYKELVKLNHPDSHGGDKDAEERLKVVNQAYATLKACYFAT